MTTQIELARQGLDEVLAAHASVKKADKQQQKTKSSKDELAFASCVSTFSRLAKNWIREHGQLFADALNTRANDDEAVYQYMDNGPAGLWQDCSHSVYLCQESDERRTLYTRPMPDLTDGELSSMVRFSYTAGFNTTERDKIIANAAREWRKENGK